MHHVPESSTREKKGGKWLSASKNEKKKKIFEVPRPPSGETPVRSLVKAKEAKRGDKEQKEQQPFCRLDGRQEA